MGRTAVHTVTYESGGHLVDLCKIIFGGDGSYFVTAPYHPHDRAVAGIITVNYASAASMSLGESIETAVVSEGLKRLKLSHHPDGFLQFSGEGIRSGRDEGGSPKGIGVMSWPLASPTLGPSFSVMFSNTMSCGRATDSVEDRLVFTESSIAHMRGPTMNGLRVTGYYFPPRWREFVVQGHDGGWELSLLHPVSQAVKRLRVVLASKECGYPGLIGLEASPHALIPDSDEPAFMLSSSTGNLRRNKEGELMGDQLWCIYPKIDLSSATVENSLNYALNSPAYKTTPGSDKVRIEGSEEAP